MVRGPVWTGMENLTLAEVRTPDRPGRSESLYRLAIPACLDSITQNQDADVIQVKRASFVAIFSYLGQL